MDVCPYLENTVRSCGHAEVHEPCLQLQHHGSCAMAAHMEPCDCMLFAQSSNPSFETRALRITAASVIIVQVAFGLVVSLPACH